MHSDSDIEEIRSWWHRRRTSPQHNSIRNRVTAHYENYFTTRYKISLLLFFAAFNCYMLRVYYSIVVVLISQDVASSIYTTPECQSEHEEWQSLVANLKLGKKHFFRGRKISPYEETASITAFHCGYTISHFVASFIVDQMGPCATVTYTFVICGSITLATSFCSHYFVPGLYVIRFSTGFLTGLLVECFYRIILSWAPLTERKIFFNKYYGFHLGTAFTYVFCGLLLIQFSWHTIPICTAVSSLVFGLVWAAYATDNPEDHLFITDSEVDFIRMRLDLDAIQWFHFSSSTFKKSFPYKRVFKSRAIWAILITFWTHYWNNFFYLDYLPVYFFEILKIDLVTMNFILGAMYLVRFVIGLVSVELAEKFITKYQSVSAARKILTVISHVLPGLLLIFNVFAKCHHLVHIVIILTALVLNGAFMGGALLNMRDLAPRYDTKLMEVLHNVCNAVGFIVVCVYRLVDDLIPDPVQRWIITTVMNGLMFVIGGLVFLIFGSVEVEIWDSPREHFENLRIDESLIL